MSTANQIRESIEARIAELNDERGSLEAARVELSRQGPGPPRPPGLTPSTARRRSSTSRAAVQASANQDAVKRRLKAAQRAASSPRAVSAGVVPADAASGLSKPRGQARHKTARGKKPVEVPLAGRLEAMLGEAEQGLSASAISKHVKAGYGQVLSQLRDLESAGRVRRTGSRRTSVWWLISDEDRIAERAAELQRLSIAKS